MQATLNTVHRDTVAAGTARKEIEKRLEESSQVTDVINRPDASWKAITTTMSTLLTQKEVSLQPDKKTKDTEKLKHKLAKLEQQEIDHFHEIEPSEIRKLMSMYPDKCFTGIQHHAMRAC